MKRAGATGAYVVVVFLTLGACDQNGAGVVHRAEDEVSVPVGQASARIMGAHQVAAYARDAVLGDMFAVASADIVLQRTKNQEIAVLARRLRDEHLSALASLEAVVRTELPSLVLPTALDKRREGLIDNLEHASRADIDRVYLDQQIAAQEEAITLHRGFAEHAASRGLAIHALSVLTPVENDLTQLRRLRRAYVD